MRVSTRLLGELPRQVIVEAQEDKSDYAHMDSNECFKPQYISTTNVSSSLSYPELGMAHFAFLAANDRKYKVASGVFLNWQQAALDNRKRPRPSRSM